MARRVDTKLEIRDTSKEHYRRKVWRGKHMNYECAHCEYATLEASRMMGHLRTVHGIIGATSEEKSDEAAAEK